MPHVAVLGLRGIPNVVGGIETHCAELLPRMAAESGNLTLTVLARRRFVPGPGMVHGVQQVPLAAPRRSGAEALVHSLWAVLYARFSLHADAVHVHAIGPGLAVPLARLLGLRVLFTHHGEDYARDKWGKSAKLLLRLGETLALYFSHQIIAVSAGTAARLKSRAPARAARINHIPNGVSAALTHGEAKAVMKRYGLTPGHFVIQVGRIEPEKGQDTMIAAFHASGAARADPSLKLLIAGSTHHESAYSRKIEAMATEGVELAGQLDRDTILRLNALAGLFVLPSLHEGLSIAALEALSAGAPVLLSDIEPNRNIDLPDRHYLPPGSVDAWAEALRGDLSRHELSDGFDAAHYDWQNIARQTLDALNRLPWARSQGIALTKKTTLSGR